MPVLTYSGGKTDKLNYLNNTKFCKVKEKTIFYIYIYSKVKKQSTNQKIFATHNAGEKDVLQGVEKNNVNNSQKKNELGKVQMSRKKLVNLTYDKKK